jgi:hypothetical protein
MSDSESTEKVKGPASCFPSIEATYQKTIPEWKQIIRQTPGYGGAVTHKELVKILKTDYGMGDGHADALVAHTLDEDRG